MRPTARWAIRPRRRRPRRRRRFRWQRDEQVHRWLDLAILLRIALPMQWDPQAQMVLVGLGNFRGTSPEGQLGPMGTRLGLRRHPKTHLTRQTRNHRLVLRLRVIRPQAAAEHALKVGPVVVALVGRQWRRCMAPIQRASLVHLGLRLGAGCRRGRTVAGEFAPLKQLDKAAFCEGRSV